jgi:alpha-beta hydrolase superfamily lysophospholipase
MAPATWVLLRGLTRERRHWGDFAGHLAHAMPGARVVAIDLPGNGEANRQRSPWSIDAMAEHARKSLRTMKLDPPYGVLAMSMGGMVATAWATNHREEIDAAVLVNTSMKPFNPYWQRLRPHNYASLFRLMLSRRPREAEARVLRLTSRLHWPSSGRRRGSEHPRPVHSPGFCS